MFHLKCHLVWHLLCGRILLHRKSSDHLTLCSPQTENPFYMNSLTEAGLPGLSPMLRKEHYGKSSGWVVAAVVGRGAREKSRTGKQAELGEGSDSFCCGIFHQEQLAKQITGKTRTNFLLCQCQQRIGTE